MAVRVLFFLCVIILKDVHAHNDTVGKEIQCEPMGLKKSASYFIEKYNMTTGLFIVADIHLSKQTFLRATPGNLDLLMGEMLPRFYQMRVNLKWTNHFEPLRNAEDVTFLFHFYYGDAITCHDFNPTTGEYFTHEIGFHSLKYFCVFEPGHFFSLTFEKHQEEKFALIGVTYIRSRTSEGHMDTYTLEEMVKTFPQHRQIIKTIYAH